MSHATKASNRGFARMNADGIGVDRVEYALALRRWASGHPSAALRAGSFSRAETNSGLRRFASGHDFSRADKPIIFVIPRGLQFPRDLLFFPEAAHETV